MNQYQEYIALSRYARWLPEHGRRESWHETVQRYIDYFVPLDLSCDRISDSRDDFIRGLRSSLYSSIFNLETMPSMRALMTAGKAADRDNAAIYNCSYLAMEEQRAFDEAMYILMCGTGDGFSVEKDMVKSLPTIAASFTDTPTVIKVRDSKIGWSEAFKALIAMLYKGEVPSWDVSKIRKKGAPLKTFGGRASGPEPLVDLFKYTINTFRRFAGKQLPTIAVHDLMCKVAEIVVVGGVRRSALISLSDLDDEYMRKAKSDFTVIEYTFLGHADAGKRKYSITVDDAPYGDRSLIVEVGDWDSEKLQKHHRISWYFVHPERALANNSVVYKDKPSPVEFMREFTSLIESNSGERGIFSRPAALNLIPERRKLFGYEAYGCNPCSEIVLRSKQFCNLSEVVVRSDDTYETLKDKVGNAAILGTLQATKTNFRYLSADWKKNTEEEALLGVSFTGIMDNPFMSGEVQRHPGFGNKGLEEVLEELRDYAVEINRSMAGILGIRPAAAVTCVKPSGTVSQLVDSASGIHQRYAPFYLRTVRADKKDPLAIMMRERGFYVEDDVMKPNDGDVFYFPIKAPEGSVFRDDRSAVQQLETWKTYQLYWCEHKPSITVFVKNEEWVDVAQWVFKNFDIASGISFLPHSDHNYPQPPYQEISEEEYYEWKKKVPEDFDWRVLEEYEKEDATVGMKEYACTGGACEIV